MKIQLKAQVLTSVQTLQEIPPVVARLKNHVVSYHDSNEKVSYLSLPVTVES